MFAYNNVYKSHTAQPFFSEAEWDYCMSMKLMTDVDSWNL